MQNKDNIGSTNNSDIIPSPGLPSSAETRVSTADVKIDSKGFDFTSMIPLLVIFVAMYFLIIRPQSKRHKQQLTMLGSIKRGDKVLLSSGIVGVVFKTDLTDKEYMLVEISQGSVIQVSKTSVIKVLDTKFGLANFFPNKQQHKPNNRLPVHNNQNKKSKDQEASETEKDTKQPVAQGLDTSSPSVQTLDNGSSDKLDKNSQVTPEIIETNSQKKQRTNPEQNGDKTPPSVEEEKEDSDVEPVATKTSSKQKYRNRYNNKKKVDED